jgi:hypothetical protein
MAKVAIPGLVVVALLLLLSAPAFAQEDAAVSKGAKIDKKVVDAAVKKACDWLKSQQKADGSFQGAGLYDGFYPYSSTAFVLFALLKGTESFDSKCIQDGFKYLKAQKEWPGVYGVSALILALCALFEPPPPPEKEMEPRKLKPGEKLRTSAYDPVEKQARDKFRKKAPKWAKDWLRRAVNYLVSVQVANVWRYPDAKPGDYNTKTARGGDQDASNTQYAMLALHAASRVGVNAKKEVYQKVAEYFLKLQEKDGPEVKPSFPVPAADLPIKKLKELEKSILKRLRKEDEAAAKKKEEVPGLKDLGPRTTSKLGDPYRDFGAELSPMKARGWSYMPPDTQGVAAWQTQATGSMTTSGVAALVICKAKLEGTEWYNKRKKKLRQAIRDGMGWIAHHFTITENPGPLDCWKYYYLYGLERSGVLCLSRRIGKHFWYEEGAKHILATQSGDGSWPGGSSSGDPGVQGFSYGPTWPTCFCILFLKKATAPVVNLPEDIYTGKGLFGPGGGKDK